MDMSYANSLTSAYAAVYAQRNQSEQTQDFLIIFTIIIVIIIDFSQLLPCAHSYKFRRDSNLVTLTYIGRSFNDQPVNNIGVLGNELFEREQEDLLTYLKYIPK